MNKTYLLRTIPDILAWYNEIRQTLEGQKYYNTVFNFCLDLDKGQSRVISKYVKAENTEKFIKCVCLFIYEQPNYGIQFSNDYLEVIRK